MKRRNIHKNGAGYRYIKFVSGAHGYKETRMWVDRTLIEYDNLLDSSGPHVDFPIQAAKIVITKKGGLVLVPGTGIVYLAELKSGYRGSANITSITNSAGDTLIPLASGHEYHSGRGALGETAWALVHTACGGNITVRGKISGRRVVRPNIVFEITPDGKEQEMLDDPEIAQLLE